MKSFPNLPVEVQDLGSASLGSELGTDLKVTSENRGSVGEKQQVAGGDVELSELVRNSHEVARDMVGIVGEADDLLETGRGADRISLLDLLESDRSAVGQGDERFAAEAGRAAAAAIVHHVRALDALLIELIARLAVDARRATAGAR